ncbi:MAG TPA: serine/threonine-protein kinase, partial [Vicinamibacterales bacterium]|nr:serine/threonine-protein kinase [Vicinamibacterales bacterium]
MFEPGSQLGRYEIQRRLGRGGMGAVYVAHDPVLGRMVAIKVFSGDLDVPDARERFSREARAAAALNHPNIVTVFDFGSYDSQPYIVMEYVPGETVAGLIRRKVPVTMADKLRWMEELAAGAGYAHQMQLVHRDIKPANLMIDRNGRLKILDFGIARILGAASNTSVMIGTPGYMAPEQITGDPVDHRADQFAMGVVFYELLAYSEAFPGDTLPMITHKILTEEPVPLERLAPDVSPDIIAIVVKALRKTAAERYDDSEALRAAISRVRKEFSSNAAWNAPTILTSRDTPPAGMGTRGTGSARRRQDDAVGVAQMTPPPDPKRTDREAIARRRLAQIEVALQQARELLAEGHLEAALDACQQALTFDETHAGAIDLEAEINVAIELREHAARASAATAATPFGRSPSTDDVAPADAVTRFDEQFPSRASSVSDRTVLRPPGVAAPRRTPAPSPPPAVPPPQPVAETPVARAPVAKAPAAKAPPPAVRKTTTPRPDPSKQIAALKARLSSGFSPLAKAMRDKRTVVWAGAGAAIVLVAAVVGGLMMFGSPQTGSVVIDAAP